MNLEELSTQVRKQFKDDYDNLMLRRRADKVFDLITPILQKLQISQGDMDEVYKISRDNGFPDIREIFKIRKEIHIL
jgi:hypothetical protein